MAVDISLIIAARNRGFASTPQQRQKEGSSLGELRSPETAQAVAEKRVTNYGYRVAPPRTASTRKRGRGVGGGGEIGQLSERVKGSQNSKRLEKKIAQNKSGRCA